MKGIIDERVKPILTEEYINKKIDDAIKNRLTRILGSGE